MTGAIAPEALSHLIGSIYDCALDPERWPATLSELHRALSFRYAGMVLQAMPSGAFLLTKGAGLDPVWEERLRDYSADVVQIWGGAELMSTYPLDEPAVLSRLRPRREWENSRVVREWAKPQGIADLMAFTLARDEGVVGSIGMGRHASAGPIGEREVAAARLLIPHLQRAVAISKVIDLKTVAAQSFAAALDVLSAAVVLVDVDLTIVHANRAAERIFAAGDPVRSERGVLKIGSGGSQAALAAAVRQAAADEAAIGRRGFGIPAPRADGAPCLLHVLPMTRGALRPGLSPAAAAAVFVAPARTPLPAPTEALAALFDLTAAEARVFARIADGQTVTEAARGLGIGAGTVKTHLSRVYAKTGARRQADLVRLAASLALPG